MIAPSTNGGNAQSGNPVARRAEVNRVNARRSTGPRTAQGKAVVSGNALRHGLLSLKPVLPFVENVADWRRHFAGVMADAAPVGYLETALAQRVALLLWRLGRVARAEREAVAVTQERGKEAAAEAARDALVCRWHDKGWMWPAPSIDGFDLDEVTPILKERQALCAAMANLATLPDEAPVSRDDAEAFLDFADTVAKHKWAEDEELNPGFPNRQQPDKKEAPDGASPDMGFRKHRWPDKKEAQDDDDSLDLDGSEDEDPDLDPGTPTAGAVRAALADLAQRTGWTAPDLLRATLESLRWRAETAQWRYADVQKHLSAYRRSNLLPDPDTLDRLGRYETSLERSLYRALHELERRQAARLGQPVPSPVAVDVTLSRAGD